MFTSVKLKNRSTIPSRAESIGTSISVGPKDSSTADKTSKLTFTSPFKISPAEKGNGPNNVSLGKVILMSSKNERSVPGGNSSVRLTGDGILISIADKLTLSLIS